MSITVFNCPVKMQISNHKLQLVLYAFDDLTVRAIATILISEQFSSVLANVNISTPKIFSFKLRKHSINQMRLGSNIM